MINKIWDFILMLFYGTKSKEELKLIKEQKELEKKHKEFKNKIKEIEDEEYSDDDILDHFNK